MKNLVVRGQTKKDILEKEVTLVTQEGKDFLSKLKAGAEDLLKYEEGFTENLALVSIGNGILIDDYFNENREPFEAIDKIYDFMYRLRYKDLLDLKAPDVEKEEREMRERAKDQKKDRMLSKMTREKGKIFMSSAIMDYYNKFLDKLESVTAKDFYLKKESRDKKNKEDGKDAFVKSLNRLNFLCMNPFISDELQLKTFKIYKKLMIELIKDGRIAFEKEGIVCPGIITLLANNPEAAFPEISEADKYLELFNPISAYRDKFLPGVVIEEPQRKTDQEVEELYDTLKEFKHKFNRSEAVLEKLAQLRKDILSGEILKQFSFKNPIWEIFKKFKLFYDNHVVKSKEDTSFWRFCLLSIMSMIYNLQPAIELTASFFDKFY